MARDKGAYQWTKVGVNGSELGGRGVLLGKNGVGVRGRWQASVSGHRWGGFQAAGMQWGPPLLRRLPLPSRRSKPLHTFLSAGPYLPLSCQNAFTSTACLPLSTSQSTLHFHQCSLSAFICTLTASPFSLRPLTCSWGSGVPICLY